MEPDDVQSDLIALRKLYGLLQANEDGSQNVTPNTLDDKARVFLKNLLDGAAGKVFETHTKSLSAQSNLPKTPYLTQPQQLKGISKLPLSVSPGSTNPFPRLAEKPSKDLNFSCVFLPKDEQSASKCSTSELSKCNASSTRHKMRRKCSWVQEQSSIKQLNRAKETEISDEKMQVLNYSINTHGHQPSDQFSHFGWPDSQAAESEPQGQSAETLGIKEKWQASKFKLSPSIAASLPCSSSNAAHKVVKSAIAEAKVQVTANMSKEVAKAIKQIESRLEFARVADEKVDPVEEKNIGQLHQGLSRVRSITNPILRNEGVITNEKNEVSDVHKSFSPRQQGQCMLNQSSNHVLVGCNLLGRPEDGSKEPLDQPPLVNGDLPTKTHCRKCGRKKASTLHGQILSHIPSYPTEAPSISRQKAAGVQCHSSRDTVNGFQPINQLIRQNNSSLDSCDNVIQGLRIFRSQIDKNDNHERMAPTGRIRKPVPSRPSLLPPFVAHRDIRVPYSSHRSGQRRALEPTWREKGSPRGIVTGHRLDQFTEPSSSYDDSKARGNFRASELSQLSRQNKIMPHQNVSETSWSSPASSGWTTGTSGSGSEAYSLSTERNSSSSEESEDSEGESESDSGSNMYSMPSEEFDNSSIESDDSSTSQMGSGRVSPALRRSQHLAGKNKLELHGVRNHRREAGRSMMPQKKSEKGLGRFKKFKNKLALIFHHHHHHHHHHPHGSDNDDTNNDQVDGGGRCTSMRKGIQDRSKEELYGEQAVEKVRHAAVSRVPPRRQQGQLQTLMGGLVKHVRNTKKSKQPKGSSIAELGKLHGAAQGGRQNMTKKLQWWQKINRRGRVKLPKKGKPHVKYGTKKKTLLGAVKL